MVSLYWLYPGMWCPGVCEGCKRGKITSPPSTPYSPRWRHRTWFCVLLMAPVHHIVLILSIKSKPLLHSESKTKIDQLPSIRCTVQCQGQWQRRMLLSRMDRRLSTRALKTKDGFSSETWFHTGPWWRAWTLWDKNYGFVYRLDLSAAGEVSELMDNAAYEVYLKECEEHWLTIHIHQIQITDFPRLC